MVRAVGAADTESTWLSKISGPAGDDPAPRNISRVFSLLMIDFLMRGIKTNKQNKTILFFFLFLSLFLNKRVKLNRAKI